MIIARNIHKHYGQLPVLKGVDLEIQKGEIATITGASGAGKTTLLQILGTLDHMSPPLGELSIGGISVPSLKEKELARFRNKHIGFVFQFHHLLPEFTAIENVCIPAFIDGSSKSKAQTDAKELLDILGLSDRLSHRPDELSGGEQQRVAVARALINKPSVVLADEPTGNLDSNSADTLYSLFKSLRDQFNYTFVVVTHSAKLAENSDRSFELKDGQIISSR